MPVSPELLARIAPDPERMDRDPATLREAFDRFCAEGLHLASPTRGVLGNYRFLAQVAQRSGALAFLALQQHVASVWLRPGEDARIGVAFGHLRQPGSRMVARHSDGSVGGTVPWFTGAGIFDEAVLGFADLDGAEVRVRIDARDRTGFRHSAPMALIAMSSTQTVRVDVAAAKDCEELERVPAGSMARRDAHGYLWQTPLMAGISRAACRLAVDAGAPRAWEVSERTEQRIAAIESQIEGGAGPEEGARQRARCARMMHQAVQLAALATGGAALIVGHPVERLCREAMVVDLMARTPAIVAAAFDGACEANS